MPVDQRYFTIWEILKSWYQKPTILDFWGDVATSFNVGPDIHFYSGCSPSSLNVRRATVSHRPRSRSPIQTTNTPLCSSSFSVPPLPNSFTSPYWSRPSSSCFVKFFQIALLTHLPLNIYYVCTLCLADTLCWDLTQVFWSITKGSQHGLKNMPNCYYTLLLLLPSLSVTLIFQVGTATSTRYGCLCMTSVMLSHTTWSG